MSNCKKKGIFITLEGPEGSGKTTHSKHLCDMLKKLGFSVLHTREPGGVRICEKIRDILLDKKNANMNRICELLLYQASRAQIASELIIPALKKGKIVVCDRYQDATYAYQGYGAGIDLKFIDSMARFKETAVVPDLTILMDIPVKQGLARSVSKDRMDQKSVKFHEKVRKGYLELAKKYPKRIKVLKVKDDFDTNQKKIRELVLNVIRRYKNKHCHS